MTDQPAAEPTPELNLCAYWYSFTFTECDPVDRILHAVARAGKGHHSTEYWADTGNEGEPSYIDRIQDAANIAADAANATAAERDRLKVVIETLVVALKDMITRFERCMVVGGTDAEFARCATAEARAVLDEARK